ncbi:MAG: Rrf2 family transcriptional regulator [Lachnospiraceae bacterium]|nr:Rrf2 family transcriptional regulator [Lachnospiraceae bacterium]
MFISKETDYAIRIIRSLSDGKLHSVNDLVESEMIPKQFAYKITKKLEKGGYIRIHRGVKGGCELSKEPENISVKDIILAIEDRVEVSHCMEPGYACPWKDSHGICTVHNKLGEIQGQVNQLLEGYSMADLLSKDV